MKIIGLLALLGLAVVPFLSSSKKAPVEGEKKARIPGKLKLNRDEDDNFVEKEYKVKEYTEE